MIETVNAAMLELQGAMLSRSLYPSEHPRTRAGEHRSLELLTEALAVRGELTVFAVDDRVIFEGRILPGSGILLDTLFRVLTLAGIDRVTFERGLDSHGLRRLLDRLGEIGKGGETQTTPIPRVRFGYLRCDSDDESVSGKSVAVAETATDRTGEARNSLSNVWTDVAANRSVEPRVLGNIVSCVSRVVTDSAGAMIPLAPLKRHDEYTFVHTINVAILTSALGEALDFDTPTSHDVSVAALLHDVGKEKVPSEVLNKKGRFNEAERAAMELHPIHGARMLLSTHGVPELAAIVAYEHHIRADGTGYPRVPRGWKLNLASRIVQLADVFDALRTHRPYRPGLPVPRIVEIMRSDAGTFFDPDLLDVFLQQVVARGIGDSPQRSDPEVVPG